LTDIADSIWNFIDQSGSSSALLTLYELQTSDAAARGCIFYQVDAELLLQAVKVLEKKGKCAIIPAQVISETGIKFSG